MNEHQQRFWDFFRLRIVPRLSENQPHEWDKSYVVSFAWAKRELGESDPDVQDLGVLYGRVQARSIWAWMR